MNDTMLNGMITTDTKYSYLLVRAGPRYFYFKDLPGILNTVRFIMIYDYTTLYDISIGLSHAISK